MIAPLRLTPSARRDLRVLFIAKHALSDGRPDAVDGNHALYHYELRAILEQLFERLTVANSHDVLFTDPQVDFVFPLLNRAGFFNSEMLCPLLCNRLAVPYLGANPIVRGIADDKHLTKLEAVNRGIRTSAWAVYRAGAPIEESRCPRPVSGTTRWVIKPNNSSASWGVGDASDWPGVESAVRTIHAEGYDAIVEPFMNGSDIEVPVLEINGAPHIMPPMLFRQADPTALRSHAEKRDLVERTGKYELVAFESADVWPQVRAMTAVMAEVFRPFDYGRFEFRFDETTGEVNLLEVNLQCNLWSQKVYGHSAALMGWSQEDLIESLMAESLRRHGLMVPL